MLNWNVANEMTPEFGAVVVTLNLVCITLVLVTLHIEEIAACISLMLKRLNAFALRARYRLWRSAPSTRH